MAFVECMPMDLFGGDDDNMIDLIKSCDGDKSNYILESLRGVNDDDTLSRVLASDDLVSSTEPQITRGLPTHTNSKSNNAGKSSNMNEEVTLCAGSSHVDSVMSECISDGIEATDIGSLLEQFLEYEKAISPALSPTVCAFPTPVPSPGNEIEVVEECIMADMLGQSLVCDKSESKGSNACQTMQPAMQQSKQNVKKKDDLMEIPEFDIALVNQVTISTSSEAEDIEDESKGTDEKVVPDEKNLNKSKNENIDTNAGKESNFLVRSHNGVIVIEAVPKETSSSENNIENSIKDPSDLSTIKDTATNVERKSNNNPSVGAVMPKSYTIPKIKGDAKNRARSRSPIAPRVSKRPFQTDRERLLARNDGSKSNDYSSKSDDDDNDDDNEKEGRFERYRSERRTPARKDDRRKRRKYSSCSDDEYDYYRYSKKRRWEYTERETNQSPVRRHNEHDYHKVSAGRRQQDKYQRSNSVRENGVKSRNLYRKENDRLRNKRRNYNDNVTYDDSDNVHERLTELATPVPYDIERERKIGFLCQRTTSKATLERRNVYAGGINRKVSKPDLIRRFEIFGPIEKVTLHFRDKGDSYAFIVFEDPKDAVKAVQEGNNDPNFDKLDLCFGGRRTFVGGSYVDFDANTSYLEENDIASGQTMLPVEDESEFDLLLKMAKQEQTS
eukprot:gene5397-6073_t